MLSRLAGFLLLFALKFQPFFNFLFAVPYTFLFSHIRHSGFSPSPRCNCADIKPFAKLLFINYISDATTPIYAKIHFITLSIIHYNTLRCQA